MQRNFFSLILILSALSLASCASALSRAESHRVIDEPVVFEDKIVFLKPVVFKAGVEFRGTVEGRGAPYYALQGASARPAAALEGAVRLEPEVKTPVEQPVRQLSAAENLAPKLTVLTYNVKMWNAWEGRPRLASVFDLVKSELPDVVAFQECGDWFYQAMDRNAWFQENYYFSRPGGQARHVGGLVLLSRYPIENVEYRELPRSNLRPRFGLVARIRYREQLVSVANVHLESLLEMGPLRRQQLENLLPMLKDDPHTLVLGDFNFGDGEPEEAVVAGDFKDLWPFLRPGHPGLTWDMDRSWMARRYAFAGEKSRRLDRILVRSTDWKPLDVRIIGDRPVPQGRGHFFGSDHFGVLGTLALLPEDA